MSSWKRDVASGLIVILPLLVSAYIIAYLYLAIAGIPILQDIEPPLRVLTVLVVFSMLVLSVGYMMRTAVGSLVEGAIDGVMNRVPGLRVVYNASKMAAETALSDSTDLQAPVKVEVWSGMRMTAFKTGKTTDDGRELLFLPTAPNITTGFVVEVEPSDFQETDESVEDALTRILSAGFGETSEAGIPIDVEDEKETQSPPPQ
ncbi:DUF502 domain-containing protein [Halorussus sp. MSC15.2]|uniref:DUF502 domain-containing protein n=1 Tax=Halorussus sp. MSC15.2 TaxID=2283638 RepID=UPI0013D5A319|nr:DUF502 domain-containing protein [Halorussus sp. MSC15.2]NEU58507.1 DUF502 domain-containing protein [Halorussus sp. MSC15.2]